LCPGHRNYHVFLRTECQAWKHDLQSGPSGMFWCIAAPSEWIENSWIHFCIQLCFFRTCTSYTCWPSLEFQSYLLMHVLKLLSISHCITLNGSGTRILYVTLVHLYVVPSHTVSSTTHSYLLWYLVAHISNLFFFKLGLTLTWIF
jgi:hypothetical protein